MQAVSMRIGKDLGTAKNLVDISCVIVSLRLSASRPPEGWWGVGLGTLIAMIGVGRVIALFKPPVSGETEAAGISPAETWRCLRKTSRAKSSRRSVLCRPARELFILTSFFSYIRCPPVLFEPVFDLLVYAVSIQLILLKQLYSGAGLAVGVVYADLLYPESEASRSIRRRQRFQGRRSRNAPQPLQPCRSSSRSSE